MKWRTAAIGGVCLTYPVFCINEIVSVTPGESNIMHGWAALIGSLATKAFIWAAIGIGVWRWLRLHSTQREILRGTEEKLT